MSDESDWGAEIEETEEKKTEEKTVAVVTQEEVKA